MIITIDGPAGSGKSTVARILATRLDLPYLNSGAIYRAVTMVVVDSSVSFDDREAVSELIRGLPFRVEEGEERTRFYLGERDVTDRIKDPDVTAEIHRIANDGGFRTLLVPLQRRWAEGRGVVSEGRDMGTVIFPEAEVKFFLDAPVEERARRQHRELLARGIESDYEQLLERVRERDGHDRNRDVAPLKAAADAIRVDTGGLTIDGVVEVLLSKVAGRSPQRSGPPRSDSDHGD